MAEAMLIGAGVGAGTSMLTGNDPLKGAAIGAGTGGIGSQLTSNPFTQEALKSGVTSTVPSHLTSEAVGSTVANGVTNPALTNGMGQSSNMLTQFGRDASEMATNAYDNVTDTIGSGFDYLNDTTGMENKDWTQMAMQQGINSMQPDPQQPIQASPMGQGISRPNVDLSKSPGSLLSSNPMASGAGGQQLTPEEIQMLKQKGLL